MEKQENDAQNEYYLLALLMLLQAHPDTDKDQLLKRAMALIDKVIGAGVVPNDKK